MTTTIRNRLSATTPAAARRRRLAGSLTFAALAVTLGLAGGNRGSDGAAVEGDPFRGRETFGDKGCSRCHSVWGHGGELGPEITVVVKGKTWYELVGDFWNHTPRMIDAIGQQGYSWPLLNRDEMADLLSYLYYLRLFDDPGDAGMGSIAYSQFQCVACHTLGGSGGDGGGPLDAFSAFPSPIVLAQAMWNAGPEMQRVQLTRMAIPVFSGSEMADIQAIEDEGAWCLEARNVKFVRTYFTTDRKRMVCLYNAPDAESVRQAQSQINMPMDRVWAFELLKPSDPPNSTVD